MKLSNLFKKSNKPINLSPSGYPIAKYDEHFKGIQVTNGYYIYNIPDSNHYRDILFQNCIVIGAQGSAKSTSSMIPNLLNPELSDMSFIVFDPSGEMYSITSDFQKKLGKDVYFLSLYHEADRLNILDFIDETEGAIKRYCEKLFTNTMKSIEGCKGVSDSASNWIAMSAPLLASSICALKMFYKENPHLGTATVSEAISLLELSTEEEFVEIVKKYNSAYKLYPFKKASQREGNIFKNCVTNITTYLSELKSPNAEYLMNETTIPVDELRKKPSVVYIKAHPNNPKMDAPILTPIIEIIFQRLSKNSAKQNTHLDASTIKDVYVFLDEFSTLGKIDGIDGFFKNLRKDRVGIFIGVQTITQLYDVLTPVQVSAILGNISHKLFLRNNNHLETSEYLSTIAGIREVEEKIYSYDSEGNVTGYRISNQKEKEVTLNEAMNIELGTGYLHIGSLGAIKINDVKGYWQSKRFDSLCNMVDIETTFNGFKYNIYNSLEQSSVVLNYFRNNKLGNSNNKNNDCNNVLKFQANNTNDTNNFRLKEVAISKVFSFEETLNMKVNKFIEENF